MAATTRDTVKALCKTLVTRLENQKIILFAPRLRNQIQDEVYKMLAPSILTDQDLRERTVSKLQASAEQLSDTGFTESEQYKTARGMVKHSFGDLEINGLYYQRTLKDLAGLITHYVMQSHLVDDVFESDEAIERAVVEMMRKFDPANLH